MASLKTLALIPARGGSKGLPNKNILPLAGHPLIAYSIAAGKCTSRIDRVVVTTDSEDIAQISKAYGADVPFLRPPELAGDYTTDLETFQHALKWLEEEEGYVPDLVLQLRPTSPIRFAREIETCIDLLERHADAQSVRTVTPSPITPYKMWFMDGPESPLRPLLTVDGMDEPFNMPRQKLPPTFWQTGTYDLIRRSVIMDQDSMTGKTILPICIENHLAIDIDDIHSFRKAEDLLEKVSCIRP
jgi:CMP-N,N'-diacetyllegionaminic acid synthase